MCCKNRAARQAQYSQPQRRGCCGSRRQGERKGLIALIAQHIMEKREARQQALSALPSQEFGVTNNTMEKRNAAGDRGLGEERLRQIEVEEKKLREEREALEKWNAEDLPSYGQVMRL